MPSLSFKDFDLNQTTITGRRNPVVELDAFKIQYKIDPETKQRTTEPDRYIVDIVARNRVQSVKLPLDVVKEATATQITDALKARKIVKVNFGVNASTLRGRCYALISNGQLVQGVSCTATEFNLVSIDEPEIDDFDDYAIELD